jgi:hypothetical protein
MTATSSDRTAFVNVTASDPDGDSVSYAVSWGDATAPTTAGNVAAVSAAHAYAAAGSYNVTVYVNDSRGASTALRALLVVPTEPSAPASLVATPGSGHALLSWSPPATSGSAVTGYRIYRGTTSGGETLLATIGANTTFDARGLTPGVTYYFRVSATGSAGEGALSNEASATPSAPGAQFAVPDCSTMGTTSGSVASCASLLALDGSYATFQEGTTSVKLFEANWTVPVGAAVDPTYVLETVGHNSQAAEDLVTQAWNYTSNGWVSISTLNGSASSDATYGGTVYSASMIGNGQMRIRIVDPNTLTGGTDDGRSSWKIDYVGLVYS